MKATATFTIDRWDETDRHEQPEVTLVRTTVEKTFTGGFEGRSLAWLTMLHAPGELHAYDGYERLDGRLDGRAGGFVLNHDATASPAGQRAIWRIVDGSGTGALAGITGQATITRHDGGGHTFELDYALPDDA